LRVSGDPASRGGRGQLPILFGIFAERAGAGGIGNCPRSWGLRGARRVRGEDRGQPPSYCPGHTVASGAAYLAVFRVVGAAGFLAYGLSQVVNSIWMGMSWANTVRAVADGLVYALVTAGCFGWLWPR